MLFFAVIMLGLLYRGRKEEEALAQVFGEDWEAYKQRVPGWIPHFERQQRKDS
jgi:protein-S-isoprenylcysteine O-methyltransferase Ste14